jgi:hypothetical protein
MLRSILDMLPFKACYSVFWTCCLLMHVTLCSFPVAFCRNELSVLVMLPFSHVTLYSIHVAFYDMLLSVLPMLPFTHVTLNFGDAAFYHMLPSEKRHGQNKE